MNAFFKLPALLIYAGISCMMLSCGPSKEEKERLDKQRGDSLLVIYNKYLSQSDAYFNALKAVPDSLPMEGSVQQYTGDMNPVLISDYENNTGNILVMDYGHKFDSSAYSKSDECFGYTQFGTVIDGLACYHNKKFDDYIPTFYTTQEFETNLSSLNTSVTPYLLVIRKIVQEKVKLEGKKSFSGGLNLGYAWLIDLRTQQVLGTKPILTYPDQIHIKDEDKDDKVQEAAVISANLNVQDTIDTWLKSFKGTKFH